MHAVRSHGAPKITMNSQEQDYQQKLRAAKAQGDGNPFVAGIQDVFEKGVGRAVENSKGYHGAPNIEVNTLIQGRDSNFEQRDTPANAPLKNPGKQTGDPDLGISSTANPQESPEEMSTRALDERLSLYAKAGGNAFGGHNNRKETMRLN